MELLETPMPGLCGHGDFMQLPLCYPVVFLAANCRNFAIPAEKSGPRGRDCLCQEQILELQHPSLKALLLGDVGRGMDGWIRRKGAYQQCENRDIGEDQKEQWVGRIWFEELCGIPSALHLSG